MGGSLGVVNFCQTMKIALDFQITLNTCSLINFWFYSVLSRWLVQTALKLITSTIKIETTLVLYWEGAFSQHNYITVSHDRVIHDSVVCCIM